MVNDFLMKLFKSYNDVQTIEFCRLQFIILNCRVNRLDIVVRNLLVLNL